MFEAGTVIIDRFEIVGELGRGGMATVYLAKDQVRGEEVALKVLHPHLVGDQGTQTRLQAELRAAARVRHDAALLPFDLHEADGRLFLSLPLHRGGTLAERVATKGPLDPDAVRAMGVRLCEVLAAAHHAGVLHRDVTPQNVMVDPVCLTDFGLAKLQDATQHSTTALGTVGYAPPEAYGQGSDPRSDLYALGAVLHFAATGRAPFEASSPMDTLKRQMAGDLGALPEGFPTDLAAVINRLLSPDPVDRPSSPDEVLAALCGASLEPPRRTAVAVPRGDHAVVVSEKEEDRGRRRAQRAKVGLAPEDLGAEIAESLKDGARTLFGVKKGRDPEAFVTKNAAKILGIPEPGEIPRAVFHRRFRLVDGVTQHMAQDLRLMAKEAGFKAKVVASSPAASVSTGVPGWAVGPAIAIMWAAIFPGLIVSGVSPVPMVFFFVAATILLGTLGGRQVSQGKLTRIPLAFDLGDLEAPVAEAVQKTAGQALADRVQAAADALVQHTVDRGEALPSLMLSDLRDRARDLSNEAADLADEVDRLEQASQRVSDAGWIRDRLVRLDTLARAGEEVDEQERQSLQAASAAQADDVRAAEEAQAQRTVAMARLLEIVATLERLRRELVVCSDECSTQALLDALTRPQESEELRRDRMRRAHAAKQGLKR